MSSLHPAYDQQGYEPSPPRAVSLAVSPTSSTKPPRDRDRERGERGERERDRNHHQPPAPSTSHHAQYRASSAVVPSRPPPGISSSSPGSAVALNGSSQGIDVYSHPAALAYSSAHPRRTIPKFGPYLLLQTLGEGEFGKVKLGLHNKWGEEVAVKLIRRSSVATKEGDGTESKMGKVEREIEVLRTLKHPNIVRLYDVIETDKYIGIIIEYASGGELFDHILAHRYLPSANASRLFSQLISGVWYIHSKGIVHRDLKLENLLLDRHRNIIITDFGFANRFAGREQGDLMSTSCGSPCYAAPELVISEGLYVGSAVDIWSCGVILYAMLAGYLPFDDDPANPDGDNINLLYRYIVNTPLTFPEYIGADERDLLSKMLVPDPRNRVSLAVVMDHPWLRQYVVDRDEDDGQETAFGRTVEDLERIAVDGHEKKRKAYREANAAREQAAREARETKEVGRTQSHARPSVPPTAVPPHLVSAKTEGDFFYTTSPTDDPFSSPFTASTPAPAGLAPAATPTKGSGKGGRDRDAGRHTIQVEYTTSPAPTPRKDKERARTRETEQAEPETPQQQKRRKPSGDATSPSAETQPRTRTQSASRPPVPTKDVEAPSPVHVAPTVVVSGPLSPSAQQLNFADTAPAPVVPPSNLAPSSSSSTTSHLTSSAASVGTTSSKDREPETPKKESVREGKKSRRNTLTVMVEPLRNTISSTLKGSRTPRTPSAQHPPPATAVPPPVSKAPTRLPEPSSAAELGAASATKASTVKANSVMQWFRSRSNNPAGSPAPVVAEPVSTVSPLSAEEDTQQTPTKEKREKESFNKHPPRTPSTASVTPSFITKFRNSVTLGTPRASSRSSRAGTSHGRELAAAPAVPAKEDLVKLLRIHHGPTEASNTTSKPPHVVLEIVQQVLEGMRVKVEREGGKFKCIRPKRAARPREDDGHADGVQMLAVSGTAGSAGVDKRGLPVPTANSSSIGGGLRGLLRRGSSQVPTSNGGQNPLSPTTLEPDMDIVEIGGPDEPIYGPPPLDSHDEVRFSIELTKIDRLAELYSLDIRRMKGGLRSYRFLYEVVRRRVDLR